MSKSLGEIVSLLMGDYVTELADKNPVSVGELMALAEFAAKRSNDGLKPLDILKKCDATEQEIDAFENNGWH